MRRIEYLACSSNPDGCWVAQQARNLVMQCGDEQPFRCSFMIGIALVVHRDDRPGPAMPATVAERRAVVRVLVPEPCGPMPNKKATARRKIATRRAALDRAVTRDYAALN